MVQLLNSTLGMLCNCLPPQFCFANGGSDNGQNDRHAKYFMFDKILLILLNKKYLRDFCVT